MKNMRLKKYLAKLHNKLKTKNVDYNAFRKLMLSQRQDNYVVEQEAGLLSIVTSVWNTPVIYLQELVQSILNQYGGTNFEWIILDNGSDIPETIDYLRTLQQYSFIKLFRVEKNLGIIKGMRLLLEKSEGQYIIPMDSDDCLYPDAIRIITFYIKKTNYPAVLYSDEDKINPDGSYGWPYFKPTWDPVLFINSCYIAHLCIINRLKALELDAYTDSNADGSHDWDTFVRFYNAGYIPKHIPEVIYSWRMHPQSTAMNASSKNYLESSQLTVLKRFLAAKPCSERYFIDKSPFFSEQLNWWLRRKPEATRKIITIVLVDGNATNLPHHFQANSYPLYEIITLPLNASTLHELKRIANQEKAQNTLLHCIWEKAQLPQQDWINDALLHFELFPDTVVLGSRMLDVKGRVIAAGNFFGYGEGCGCPDQLRPFYDRGFFGRLWKPHSVSSVSSQNIVFDSQFLNDFFASHTDLSSISIYYLGEWTGAFARRSNKRVIYTPFLSSVTSENWHERVTLQEKDLFNNKNYPLFLEENYFSKHLNASGKVSYQPWTSAMRTNHLTSLKTEKTL